MTAHVRLLVPVYVTVHASSDAAARDAAWLKAAAERCIEEIADGHPNPQQLEFGDVTPAPRPAPIKVTASFTLGREPTSSPTRTRKPAASGGRATARRR